MNKTYNNAIVVGTVTKKVTTQIKNYLQIFVPQENKIVYVAGKFTYPPLPGTIIDIKGEIKNNSPEFTLIQSKQDDITFISGHQGLLIFESIKKVLSRLKIQFDEDKLRNAVIQPETHMCLITEQDVLGFLGSADVKNPANIMADHGEFIAQTLVSAMFQGLETIRYPNLNLKINDDLPFMQSAYPYDVISGFFPDYISISLGQAKHKQTRRSNIFITDFLRFNAIDNFFNLLAVNVNNAGLLIEWINHPRRSSTITNTFIKDSQTSGSEVFYPEDFEPLKKLGVNQPEMIAAKNNSMYGVDNENYGMLPQGVYQAVSRVATMDMLDKSFKPLANNVELKKNIPSFLDPEQKACLEHFIDGSPALLVVGPPGAGKSTIFNEMAKICNQAGEKYLFLTPTGKAAARLNQTSDISNAATVHSLFYRNKDIDTNAIRGALDGNSSQMFPIRLERYINLANTAEPDKKPTDQSIYRSMHLPESLEGITVFIDESSQLTTSLLASILELKPKRIIMAGDPSQLDPVGAGQPFQDLILSGRNGELPEHIVLSDLKTDHRATKQLAASTAKIRAGQLPLEDVIIADGDNVTHDLASDVILDNEFSILETKGFADAESILTKTIEKELENEKPFYDIIKTDEVSSAVKTIGIDVTIADALKAKTITIPNVMVTAFTNDEVDVIANELSAVYRSNNVIQSSGMEIPQLASLTNNNIQIGDIIMETKNNRLNIKANSPLGTIQNTETMNGECYAFIGANVWLPTVSNATSDFGNMYMNLWKNTGYYVDFYNDLTSNPEVASDPNWHYEWFAKLQSSNSEEAHQICRLALVEALLIDTNTILDGKDNHYSLNVKRKIILPKLPKKSASTIQNDDGSRGIIRYWGIESVGKENDLNKDRDNYVKLANESAASLTSFKSGNAFTVHKAQGSQAKTAICLVSAPLREDEDFNHEPGTYTALTRGKERGSIVLHGITADEINDIWNRARRKKMMKKSPLRMILKGDIAPLAQSHQFNTVHLENGEKFYLNIDKPDYSSRMSLYTIAQQSAKNIAANSVDNHRGYYYKEPNINNSLIEELQNATGQREPHNIHIASASDNFDNEIELIF